MHAGKDKYYNVLSCEISISTHEDTGIIQTRRASTVRIQKDIVTDLQCRSATHNEAHAAAVSVAIPVPFIVPLVAGPPQFRPCTTPTPEQSASGHGGVGPHCENGGGGRGGGPDGNGVSPIASYSQTYEVSAMRSTPMGGPYPPRGPP